MNEIDFKETVVFFRCKGCAEPVLKRTLQPALTTSAQFKTIDYLPPRLWHKAPHWLSDLRQQDESLQQLLNEVYMAAHRRQHRLLAMGVRAALDKVMVRVVGDIGNFENKLQKMVDDGYLSRRDKEDMAAILDVGSAAGHRGYSPSQPILEEMLSTMEAIIRKHYLSGPMITEMRKNVPPRPSKTKVETLPFSQQTIQGTKSPPKKS